MSWALFFVLILIFVWLAVRRSVSANIANMVSRISFFFSHQSLFLFTDQSITLVEFNSVNPNKTVSLICTFPSFLDLVFLQFRWIHYSGKLGSVNIDKTVSWILMFCVKLYQWRFLFIMIWFSPYVFRWSSVSVLIVLHGNSGDVSLWETPHSGSRAVGKAKRVQMQSKSVGYSAWHGFGMDRWE